MVDFVKFYLLILWMDKRFLNCHNLLVPVRGRRVMVSERYDRFVNTSRKYTKNGIKIYRNCCPSHQKFQDQDKCMPNFIQHRRLLPLSHHGAP